MHVQQALLEYLLLGRIARATETRLPAAAGRVRAGFAHMAPLAYHAAKAVLNAH